MNEAPMSGGLRPSEAAATITAAQAMTITEIVSRCSYCTMISPHPYSNTPVHCIKLSGSFSPVLVNLATCLSCEEYKNAKYKM